MLYLLTMLILAIFCLILLWHLARGAAFVPTRPEKVEKIVAMAQVKPGEKAADLGSGDGRIVIALARAGAEAHGYENNPLLVWWSRRKIKKAGLTGRTFIHMRSFWGADLSDYSIITVYGIDYIMRPLGNKLKKELHPGSRVLSYCFPLPGWTATRKETGIYLYSVSEPGGLSQ